ncbi:MAG: 4Fe-4S dicluster domain-containing protein [Syntrophomonadaceae bacterium]|nr:4Fe-4S dicluster domain-containing protein [Syntrophomonadaceae bacterium]
MSVKVLFIDYRKCVGCATCEMICSLVNEGVCTPSLSRIRVVRNEKNNYSVPITCAFCDKPPCAGVCPVTAIVKNRETGAVEVRNDLCIGCRQCVQACPFGHMSFDVSKGVAFKCDLCGGDPECVKFCWTKAIQFIPLDMALDSKRRTVAERFLEESGVI